MLLGFLEVILIHTGTNKMIINLVGGSGQMGRTHRPIFEAAGHKIIISGRETSPNLEEAAKLADITIISVPISVTEEVIKKVAPHCKALMDLTGVKIDPIETMLKFSKPDCEVGGLHPLYGERKSIQGETIIYCPTARSGEKCKQIIDSLKQAGAKIKIMTPEEHDKEINLTQNKRTLALKEYATQLMASGKTIEELYISPAPTKILLDLIAKQVSEDNGEMYEEMIRYNKFADKENKSLKTPAEIRAFFGSYLKPAQERAKKYLEISRTSEY